MKIFELTSRPSQVRALANSLANGEKRGVFLDAVTELLSKSVLDGGATDDLVVSTAIELASAGVWDFLPASELVGAIANCPPEMVARFIDALPSKYKAEVKTLNSDSPRDTPNPHGPTGSVEGVMRRMLNRASSWSVEHSGVHLRDGGVKMGLDKVWKRRLEQQGKLVASEVQGPYVLVVEQRRSRVGRDVGIPPVDVSNPVSPWSIGNHTDAEAIESSLYPPSGRLI